MGNNNQKRLGRIVSQLSRCLRIVQLMASGIRFTTDELRQRLGVSVSLETIQRDLKKLSDANVPLVYDQGKKNERIWYLASGFKSFIPRLLTTNEIVAAYLLRKLIPSLSSTNVKKDAESLLEKLDQLIPPELFAVSDLDEGLHVFETIDSGSFDYSDNKEVIDTAINAIASKSVCRVTYQAGLRSSPISYEVEPHKILIHKNMLYLVVYKSNHKAFLALAIHRIHKLKALKKTFRKEVTFDLDEFRKQKFGLFPGEPQKVKLSFSRDVAPQILHRNWHPTQKTKKKKDGSVELNMTVPLTLELMGWILSWQSMIEVLDPPELRQMVKTELKKISKKYSKTT